MLNYIRELIKIQSVSGCEENIAQYIKGEMEKYFDECTIDALGNLICHKNSFTNNYFYSSGTGSLTKLTISSLTAFPRALYPSGRSAPFKNPGIMQDWGQKVALFCTMLK